MNADSPKRLGRGLNALFGDQEAASELVPASAPVPPPAAAAAASGPITRLPVDLLSPSPYQPRRHFDETALGELADSVREKGVLQPLLVRPDRAKPGHYEIIAGERRWRAAQRAQVHEVPVHVSDLSDAETLEVALIENLQRQDLSPVEEARGYQRLLEEFGHTQERVGEIVGKSRAHVANTLRLLNLPFAVLQMLEEGKISAGQARPLIGVSRAEEIAREVVKKGMSARQAERFAKSFGRKRRAAAMLPKDTDTAALEQSLSKATGYKVSIAFDGTGGAVTIAYASLEQLDDIVHRLSGGSPRREPLRPDEMISLVDD
ncbi:MAG: ParB/RepB/Spo0J family partition protein [Rhodospirillaceae bacterium]